MNGKFVYSRNKIAAIVAACQTVIGGITIAPSTAICNWDIQTPYSNAMSKKKYIKKEWEGESTKKEDKYG